MFVALNVDTEAGTIPVNVDGVDVDTEVMEIRLVVFRAQLQTIADAFDPASSSSPPAADCRSIARPIIEAIIAARSTP